MSKTELSRVIRTPAILSLGLATLSFAIFFAAMAYPWQLAVLAATAIGALVYSTHTTWTRMRRLFRPPEASDLILGERGAGRREMSRWEEDGRSAQLAPGKADQSQREQQMQPSAEHDPRHQQDHPA